MEGGRRKARDPREEVGEEASGLAQERALRLYSSELLKESQGYDLGVREPLEGGVQPSPRVEMSVGVVYQTEQNGDRLF
jgi:hypothetical protein